MTTPRRPLGRYDEPTTVSRGVLITGAVVGGVALLVFAWFGYSRFSSGRAQYGVTGYHVVDNRSVEIRFEVHKDLRSTVTCALVARDRNNATVGGKDVVVGPGERETVQVTELLSTTARAATADVSSCSRPTRPTGP